MITAIKYAREKDVPYLGVCLGMQMACVEFARDVLGHPDANSTEMNPRTKHNVIDLMADQEDVHDMGGTQRLGAYPCKLKPGTVAAKAYDNADVISERHRHRYEFNNAYRDAMEKMGWLSQEHLQTITWLKWLKFRRTVSSLVHSITQSSFLVLTDQKGCSKTLSLQPMIYILKK